MKAKQRFDGLAQPCCDARSPFPRPAGSWRCAVASSISSYHSWLWSTELAQRASDLRSSCLSNFETFSIFPQCLLLERPSATSSLSQHARRSLASYAWDTLRATVHLDQLRRPSPLQSKPLRSYFSGTSCTSSFRPAHINFRLHA